MPDSYLLDVGWFFFAAWGVVVAVVSYKAFAPDGLTVQHDRSAKKLNHGGSGSR